MQTILEPWTLHGPAGPRHTAQEPLRKQEKEKTKARVTDMNTACT